MIGSSFKCLIAGLVASAAVACGASVPDETASTEHEVAETLADDNAPLLVKDPRTLVALEERGLSLGAILGGSGSSADELAAIPAYKRIASTVDFDLRMLRSEDPKSGVGIEFPHRQFDVRWLTSPQARFELVAVVNRLDRAAVLASSCGEVRLIYRLAYTAERSASRLPMTVNVVYPEADDGHGCATVAQRWLDARSGTPDAILGAGLFPRTPSAIGQIEINFQAVRWPSNERREMGGHAEYILRVFRPTRDGNGVEPLPLENTPRTDLDDAEKEELRGWIRDHVVEIDRGTALVPEKFLATRSLSVGPRGLGRMANKSFSQLFGSPNAQTTFADVTFAGTSQVTTPVALLRRLDTMTCHGCHQARSVAGFHLLGEERDPGARLNALAIGRSPHMLEELPWRTAFVEAIARGESLASAPPRPFAEHATNDGKFGAHCGLGDPGFASWTCAAGLECLNVYGGSVGTCSPPEAPVGDVCETVRITPNANPHRDRIVDRRELTCSAVGRDARCNPVEQGFPDGMCRIDCSDSEVGRIDARNNAICGLVPSASGLTQCLAAHRPFEECLRSQNTPTFLRTCDRTEPCRDDYACTRVPGGPAGTGACMPPYFAFQARVDGHLL